MEAVIDMERLRSLINEAAEIVNAPALEPEPTPEWDRVLSGVWQGDLAPTLGERWLIAAPLQVNGHVFVNGNTGSLHLRPGCHLVLRNYEGLPPNRELYVGGGMTFESARHINDFGIWLGPGGVLDIKGTPKSGWNRYGMAPDWDAADEMWIAPSETIFNEHEGHNMPDLKPRRWYPGDPVPRIQIPPDKRLPPTFPLEWKIDGIPTEVMNVTRDIVIEGPGHIHDHSHIPQSWEYAQLRNMGIVSKKFEGPAFGRYACHRHHSRDPGGLTIWRGIAAIDCGRVFVPHGSDFVLVDDCVSVNSLAEALWWDARDKREEGLLDRSNDITVNRLCVSGVRDTRWLTDAIHKASGVVLVGGLRLVFKGSAVSGVQGGQLNRGVEWTSAADNAGPAEWEFEETNVVHNNVSSGLRFWNNNSEEHDTSRVITYRNGHGVENGAYLNANRFFDILCIEDTLFAQANGKHYPDQEDRRQTWERCDSDGIIIGHVRIVQEAEKGEMYMLFRDCRCNSRVVVDGNQRTKFAAKLELCGLIPDNVRWPATMPPETEGSWIEIEGPEGHWRITVQGGVPTTAEI